MSNELQAALIEDIKKIRLENPEYDKKPIVLGKIQSTQYPDGNRVQFKEPDTYPLYWLPNKIAKHIMDTFNPPHKNSKKSNFLIQ